MLVIGAYKTQHRLHFGERDSEDSREGDEETYPKMTISRQGEVNHLDKKDSALEAPAGETRSHMK